VIKHFGLSAYKGVNFGDVNNSIKTGNSIRRINHLVKMSVPDFTLRNAFTCQRSGFRCHFV
jgi:hypothetical protein